MVYFIPRHIQIAVNRLSKFIKGVLILYGHQHLISTRDRLPLLWTSTCSQTLIYDWYCSIKVLSKYCPPQLEQQCHFTYQHIYKISQQTKEEMRNTAQLSTTEYELQLYVYINHLVYKAYTQQHTYRNTHIYIMQLQELKNKEQL